MCQTEISFPQRCIAKTEAFYHGRLRADLAFFDWDKRLLGIIEVIDTHPPTPEAFAVQKNLPFAYYRLLRYRSAPKRRAGKHDIERGKFTYIMEGQQEPKWICSPECLTYFNSFEGANLFNEWEAPRCYQCNGYFHANRLAQDKFLDWNNPYYPLCIHCAAAVSDGTTQWRSPGDLAGGDPRKWIPTNGADATTLLMAYCDAAFWSMVWVQRVDNLYDADNYFGERHPQAEDATEARLLLVHAAFDSGQWEKGAALLSPIGAPRWAAYPDETMRLLAWRPENCRGTAAAWERLKEYRLKQLPFELSRGIPRERIPIYLHCRNHGDYLYDGNGEGCSDCLEQRRSEEAQFQRKLIEEREVRQARFELNKSRLNELQRRFDEQTNRLKRSSATEDTPQKNT
ncbi:MAG: hypothetical protein F4Y44_01050 [Chloroflexi bacterium]|nr:hypothetical protein [Chloroflexota bacterium]